MWCVGGHYEPLPAPHHGVHDVPVPVPKHVLTCCTIDTSWGLSSFWHISDSKTHSSSLPTFWHLSISRVRCKLTRGRVLLKRALWKSCANWCQSWVYWVFYLFSIALSQGCGSPDANSRFHVLVPWTFTFLCELVQCQKNCVSNLLMSWLVLRFKFSVVRNRLAKSIWILPTQASWLSSIGCV